VRSLNYIDLFAGGGGLSEGFIKQGFLPIAHVESDKAACNTLRTRMAFHHLYRNGQLGTYESYLKGEMNRPRFYERIPSVVLDSVINAKIGGENDRIFDTIDGLLDGRQVDVIIGGPPCQAYAEVGRAPLKHKVVDERRTLYVQYGRFLSRYLPDVFVFENVPGILTASDGVYFKNLRKYYKRLGYEIEGRVLNARDSGVIQDRERVILVGWRKGLHLSYPEITTVKDCFSRDDIFCDLPAVGRGEDSRYCSYARPTNDYLKSTGIRNGEQFVTQHITRPHNDRDLTIYQLAIRKLADGQRLRNNQIPEDLRTQANVTDFLDRFKVVDVQPHTVLAHIAKDGHHYIHPDIAQLRSISVREAARIQSFPDNYFFEGFKETNPRTSAFRQIGNAVPPLMAERIATSIKGMIDR
jgi:DNA (cytosine-5)-methyltransferase 1